MTPASGSPFPTGISPNSVATDPLGRFIYVTNFVFPQTVGPDVSDTFAYSIDRNADTLHTVPGSPFGVGGPVFAAVDPSGKFLYVSISNGTYIFGVGGYSIDGTTGALTGVGGMYKLGTPSATAFAPSGNFFYALDDRPPTDFYQIASYSFNNVSGTLSPLPTSPLTVHWFPVAISIDPSGKFAYVASSQGNNVSAYTVDVTTGNLTAVPGSPFVAGTSPISVAIVNSSSTPFANFVASADIDEDRKTSFRVAGFFTLADASAGIDPLTQDVQLQVGSFSATVPAGSFREAGKHAFKFEGPINGADLKITINAIEERVSTGKKGKAKRVDSGNYLFTAEGKGKILAGVVNPVQIALSVGSDGGSTTVTAIIEK